MSCRSSPEAKESIPLLRATLERGDGTAARVEVTLPPLKTPVVVGLSQKMQMRPVQRRLACNVLKARAEHGGKVAVANVGKQVVFCR